MGHRAFRILPHGIVVAVSLVIAPVAAPAMEGSQSPYLKGVRDFLTGVLPPPGVQIRSDSYLYNGTEHTTIPQGQLTAHAHAFTNLLTATITTPYKLWGADYGFALRFAGQSFSGDRTIVRGPFAAHASGDVTGNSDLVVTPLILGWHAGDLHWNFSVTGWIPAGSYEKNRIANTSKNYWSVSPQLGLTWLDRATGWEVSGAAVWIINSENTATHYRSGDIAHLDLIVGKYLTRQVKLGVAGYYVQQLTDDSGAGAIIGGHRERVAGIGPALSVTFPVGGREVLLVAKYYREFGAQNTTQGDAGSLSARVHF